MFGKASGLMSKHQGHNKGEARYKIWFDLSVLILAHVILLPLWAAIWTVIPTLIWLGDRGPVFYRQKRVGKNGHIFTIVKFRTMVLDADRKGPAWTVDGDPRVTRFGKILRKSALDELPGLLSIWNRDMSLVGPRALDVEEQQTLEKLIPGFEGRLKVLPGLTGLAQVYDKTDDAHDKFRYDLEYLDRMSPWLDVRLLVLSLLNTLGAKWDRRGGKEQINREPQTRDMDNSEVDPEIRTGS
jgi:lipopolysaccharide/colanic/teichoic acid biosynthesis glycosyltransferase